LSACASFSLHRSARRAAIPSRSRPRATIERAPARASVARSRLRCRNVASGTAASGRGGAGGGVGRQAALQLEQRAGPRFIDPAEIYKTSRAHLFPPPSRRPTPCSASRARTLYGILAKNAFPRDAPRLISERKADPKGQEGEGRREAKHGRKGSSLDASEGARASRRKGKNGIRRRAERRIAARTRVRARGCPCPYISWIRGRRRMCGGGVRGRERWARREREREREKGEGRAGRKAGYRLRCGDEPLGRSGSDGGDEVVTAMRRCGTEQRERERER